MQQYYYCLMIDVTRHFYSHYTAAHHLIFVKISLKKIDEVGRVQLLQPKLTIITSVFAKKYDQLLTEI